MPDRLMWLRLQQAMLLGRLRLQRVQRAMHAAARRHTRALKKISR